jgi:predicted metal-binding membrane protein
VFVTRVDDRRLFLGLLVALILLAWLALFVWGESPYGRYLDHERLAEVDLRLNAAELLPALLIVGGWTVMIFAMMLPTSLPLVSMFQRVTQRRADRRLLVVLLIAGYLLVWAAFGVFAHAGDWAVHRALERSAWLADNSWAIGAGVLLTAGVYQFTPLKYHCLDKCRSPLSFISQHWSGGNAAAQALRLGLHHGLFCVGCCWSLMLLMFAVGTGSVGWMLALGAVMAIEKNMPWGKQLSAPLGLGLVVLGVLAVVLEAPGGACAC